MALAWIADVLDGHDRHLVEQIRAQVEETINRVLDERDKQRK